MNFEICDIVRSSDSSLVVEVTDSLGSSIGCKEAGIDDTGTMDLLSKRRPLNSYVISQRRNARAADMGYDNGTNAKDWKALTHGERSMSEVLS